METCDRCDKSIIGEKSVTARRKDGSTATLCPDCAAELKARRSPTPQPKAIPTPVRKPPPAAKKAGKKEDSEEYKWYVHIILGVVLIGFMVLVFMEFNELEQGVADSVRIWWPIAVTYKIFGLWGAVACPGLLALLSFVVGIKKLLAEENE